MDATPLQAFAAGAALCSTSLGTTFSVLATSGLSETRLGTALTSAAMMDDVAGLVMVQVISNLGKSAGGFDAVTVVRPVVVSLGFATLVPLLCHFVVRPVTVRLRDHQRLKFGKLLGKVAQATHSILILHTLILFGFVTGASYAGTSNLFAAYMAGSSISWWDSELSHSSSQPPLARPNAQSSSREPISTLTCDHDKINVCKRLSSRAGYNYQGQREITARF